MIEAEVKNGTIVLLRSPTASFVSLVKRSANRTPFRIVKNCKENPMRIIQRIVADRKVDVEEIKKAVGEECQDALDFSKAEESGSFVSYEQHPVASFKADSLEVVPLNEAKTILGVAGEMVEKSEGFVAKLFAKPQTVKAVEIADDVEKADESVLKGTLGAAMWDEMTALCDLIHGVIEQGQSTNEFKLETIRTACANFLKSLETAVALKCDVLVRPVVEQAEEAEQVEKAEHEEPSADAGDAEVAKMDKEDVAPAEAVADQAVDAAQPEDVEKSAEEPKAEEDAFAVLSQKFDEFMAEVGKRLDKQDEVIKSVQEGGQKTADAVASVADTIAKMQKAPAGVVASHEDNGAVQKSEKPENVFKGIFGQF